MYMEQDSVVLKQRRIALRSKQALLGLDYAKLKIKPIDSTAYDLELHFIGTPDPKFLAAITPDNIVITPSVDSSYQPFTIISVSQPTAENYHNVPANVLTSMLVVTLKSFDKLDIATESTNYTVSLINVANVDPFFASVSFRSQENISTNKDCRSSLLNLTMPEVIPGQEANANYLAKDYASFRQLMLTRLMQLIPDWPQDNPADFGNVIVEILAYAADQLSYYQDAVATEAYLSTARKRTSVRRHARLLNYRMHEGCNARVWTQIQANQQFVLPKGSALLTKTINDYPVCIQNVALAELAEFAAVNNCLVFTTIYPINVYPEHNAISFYLWGNAKLTLPSGTTKATLQTHLKSLQAGDVLIFEEIQDEGQLENISVARRHAIRLLSVELTQDALASSPQGAITQITWHPEDALPFDFNVTPTSVVRGNIALADQGLPIINEELTLEAVSDQNTYSATFKQNDLTFWVPFNADMAATQSATQLLQQDPHLAQPSVELWQEDKNWMVKPDLLNSNHQSQDFVVEIENNRQAFIRFGDGIYGKVPSLGTSFKANYRSGNGSVGNIGAEALAHIIIFNNNTLLDSSTILQVRNPLPAQGGVDYEPLAQIKRLAPHAFTTQQRCVIPKDYVQMLEQHPLYNFWLTILNLLSFKICQYFFLLLHF